MSTSAATPNKTPRKDRAPAFKTPQVPVSDIDWLAVFLECATESGQKGINIDIDKAANLLQVKHTTVNSAFHRLRKQYAFTRLGSLNTKPPKPDVKKGDDEGDEEDEE